MARRNRAVRPVSGAFAADGWLCLRLVIVLLLFWAGAGRPSTDAAAQDESRRGAVVVVPISGVIDLGLAPFLIRTLDEAAASGAAAVLLEIDTPGGRLDAVLQMRDALLNSPVRTIAYVDRTAFSAGALIAIAAEEIYMPPGAVIGAATPVDGGTGETASEKVVSAVRTTFKATAEARGRDPLVAEAMVDPNVVIEGLVERGELLTLTTTEATQWGYADGVASNRAEVLAAAGLAATPVVEVEPSGAERVVRFITDPVAASLLLILALLLIVGDFFVEGFGVAGMAGVALFGVFFWGHLLAGLAGWEDVALVAVGLGLIAVEIFIVPGFGVPGVLGLAALGGGLFLAMLGREMQTPEGMVRAALTVAASLAAVVIGMVIMLSILPRSKRLSGLILEPAGGPPHRRDAPSTGGWLRWFGEAATPARPESGRDVPPARLEPGMPAVTTVGTAGVAVTDLRPDGVAEIDGRRVYVVSGDGHIQAGVGIVVSGHDRNRRLVRRAERP